MENKNYNDMYECVNKQLNVLGRHNDILFMRDPNISEVQSVLYKAIYKASLYSKPYFNLLNAFQYYNKGEKILLDVITEDGINILKNLELDKIELLLRAR